MATVGSTHVQAAFDVIRRKGIAPNKPSTKWDIIDPKTGERFPPKAVLRVAKELAGDGSRSGGGGWPTNDVLEALSFEIAPKNDRSFNAAEEDFLELSNELLKKIAERHSKRITKRGERVIKVVERSPAVSAYVKRLAKGKCDLCRVEGPFKTKQGPFLECHHISRLADGGADSVENAVALCPNCHRKMHLLNTPADLQALQVRVRERG